MENASKALLIAGAILIVIALISVGVLIVNRMSGVTDEAGSETDRMAIETYNKKFEPYIGDKMSASQVRQLVSIVNSNNTTHDIRRSVIIERGDNNISVSGGADGKIFTVTVKNTETYNVTATYTKGYITKLTITTTKTTYPTTI